MHCDCFVMYVVTSATTSFVLSWSRSSTRGSIMATSCLLGFLPIFNAAARLIFRFRRYDHVSDALTILHWLRLPERVNFKLALMAYRVLNGMSSSYLNKLVSVSSMSGRRRLRSSFTLHAAANPVVPSVNSWPSLVYCRSLHFLEHSAR